MLPCGTQEKLLPQFNKKWKPGKLCNRTNILHLHQLTPISTLRHSVPVPKYRPIADALPNWGIRELYEKIPQYHGNGPKGPIHFHRGCLGQYPWQTKQKVDFFLNDPYGNEVSYTYNPLHDPHLERWINMANNRTLLYKKGLITSDLEVICSLKEYNEFRRFLWRIHKDSVNRKIKMKEKQNQEQKQIIYANLNHEKDIAKKVAKLKVLLASKNSNENVSSTSNDSKKKNIKTNQDNKKSGIKRNTFKKIETYTRYGKNKSGLIDPTKYEGTFIKGSPNNYFVLDFFSYLFEKSNSQISPK